MTVTEFNPPSTAATGKHRAVSTELPPARRQSFTRLVTTELRKSVDTRSGRILILAILVLAVAALAWQLTHPEDGAARFEAYLGAGSTGALLLLPVIGVMAMTSEWTQRTALTTFTLSPRRIRVQLAKFASAILLSIVVLSATVLLALAATTLGGAIEGDGTSYAGLGGVLAGTYLTNALNVVMGAAFGAVIAQTTAAVLVYFIAPTAWSIAGSALFKDNADWLDVWSAFGRIAERDLHGAVPQTLTALTVWIVLPTAAGLWASSRREVK
jgi:ABC-type transport system involved in multi-copper enzyme maturation permease subunit